MELSTFKSLKNKSNSLALKEIALEWDSNLHHRVQELSEGRDSVYKKFLIPTFVKAIEQLVYISSNDNILDIGCGTGFLTSELCSLSKNVVGIDISEKSIKYAQETFPCASFKCSSVAEFAKENNSESIVDSTSSTYDMCVSNMVFHNDPEFEQTLDSIFNLLTDDGILISALPHPWIWLQTHPFRILGNSGEQIQLDYSKQFSLKIHFQIKGGERHPSPVTYIHRPIGSYLSTLKRNGFLSTTLFEFPYGHLSSDLLLLVSSKSDKFEEKFEHVFQRDITTLLPSHYPLGDGSAHEIPQYEVTTAGSEI